MIVNRILNTFASFFVAVTLLIPVPAHAINLGDAKNQGLVCELPTGYLKPTGSATAEVKKLVQNINAKRKAEYTRIANENNVKPEQVGILTGKKLGPKCP